MALLSWSAIFIAKSSLYGSPKHSILTQRHSHALNCVQVMFNTLSEVFTCTQLHSVTFTLTDRHSCALNCIEVIFNPNSKVFMYTQLCMVAFNTHSKAFSQVKRAHQGSIDLLSISAGCFSTFHCIGYIWIHQKKSEYT